MMFTFSKKDTRKFRLSLSEELRSKVELIRQCGLTSTENSLHPMYNPTMVSDYGKLRSEGLCEIWWAAVMRGCATDQLLQKLRKLRPRPRRSTLLSPFPSAMNTLSDEECLEIIEKEKIAVLKQLIADGRTKEMRDTIFLNDKTYRVVREVIKDLDWESVDFDSLWTVGWTRGELRHSRLLDVQHFQIVNHIPGLSALGFKDRLAANLNRMRSLYPNEYNFYPFTWILPKQYRQFESYSIAHRNQVYICKPKAGAEGRGIFLARSTSQVNPYASLICQLYVRKPFLIDGYKVDFRVYVLITSVLPLRVYVHDEGLARLASVEYVDPLYSGEGSQHSFMHLTNYAVNKKHYNFNRSSENGSKRKISNVLELLRKQGVNTNRLVRRMDDAIVKTIISGYKHMKSSYRKFFGNRPNAAFEILGFDILLDRNMNPNVLEVNRMPSFGVGCPIDMEVKKAVITNTFKLLNLGRLNPIKALADLEKRNKKSCAAAYKSQKQHGHSARPKRESRDDYLKYELNHCGGYRPVYPNADVDYRRFFRSAEDFE